MRNSAWSVRWKSTIAAAVICWSASPVCADWSDNFNGGLQQTWQFGDVEVSPTFSAGVVNDTLVLTDPTSDNDGGTVTGFGLVFEVFEDVRMTGIINPAGDININDTVGLLVRANLLNQSFYMAEINYSSGDLIIYRNGGEGNSNLVTEPIPGLFFTDSLYVEIEAIGDQLTAWAYDAPGGNLRATTTVTDTSFSSGVSGVLVDSNDASIPTLGVWDDLTSEAIVASVPGDFDEDGDVDGADFVGWQSTDPAQIPVWEANYGTMPSAGISAVPEPSSLLLAGGLGLLAVVHRRRWL